MTWCEEGESSVSRHQSTPPDGGGTGVLLSSHLPVPISVERKGKERKKRKGKRKSKGRMKGKERKGKKEERRRKEKERKEKGG